MENNESNNMSDEDCDYELGNVSFGEEDDNEEYLENDIDEALEHSKNFNIDLEHYKQVRDSIDN